VHVAKITAISLTKADFNYGFDVNIYSPMKKPLLVAIAGRPEADKTTLAHRLLSSSFNAVYLIQIGYDFMVTKACVRLRKELNYR
jgi:hypothetical protein